MIHNLNKLNIVLHCVMKKEKIFSDLHSWRKIVRFNFMFYTNKYIFIYLHKLQVWNILHINCIMQLMRLYSYLRMADRRLNKLGRIFTST